MFKIIKIKFNMKKIKMLSESCAIVDKTSNNGVFVNVDINVNSVKNPLSLYFHIPFCKSLCFYCACAKIITHKQERSVPYLERLNMEIAKQAALFNRDREVTQLHFGGGTPTFLTDYQFSGLLAAINSNFNLAPPERREFSIEIDPRAVRDTTIPLLRELGFDRISLGVQDFDPKVQKAVNRIQSIEQTFAVLDAARSLGFQSTNLDLIYGLPFQTVETFSRTLDIILAKRPERLAVYSYAHIPAKVKSQSLIHSENLPSAREKLAILEMTVGRLCSEGYIYLGMDHFALKTDSMHKAMDKKTLHRNFMGYTASKTQLMVGLGMSSISDSWYAFAQNAKTVDEYTTLVNAGKIPIFRGHELTTEDLIIRKHILNIMCHFETSWTDTEMQFAELPDCLERLKEMEQDGLVTITANGLSLPEHARPFVRNICMAFDLQLIRNKPTTRIFSMTI